MKRITFVFEVDVADEHKATVFEVLAKNLVDESLKVLRLARHLTGDESLDLEWDGYAETISDE